MVLLVGLIAPWVEYKVNGHYIRPYIFAALVVFGLYPLYDWVRLTPPVYVHSLKWVRYGFLFLTSTSFLTKPAILGLYRYDGMVHYRFHNICIKVSRDIIPEKVFSLL